MTNAQAVERAARVEVHLRSPDPTDAKSTTRWTDAVLVEKGRPLIDGFDFLEVWSCAQQGSLSASDPAR